MKCLKIFLIPFLAFAFNAHTLFACHGSPLMNYNVTVGATGVTINAASDPATCGCGPYWLQTQISCSPAFAGTIPSCLIQKLAFWNTPGITQYVSFPYFNSILNVPNYTAPNWIDNCALENYNSNFIPFSGLCPGKVYYIRSREVVTNPPFGGVGTPFPSYGPWTAVQSFTVPGTAPAPIAGNLTLNLNAAPQNVICGGGTVLTPSWLGSCPSSCAPTFPSCEATTTVVPSYSFVASNPVIPASGGPVSSTVVPAASASSVVTIPNLPSTTSFSVYFVYEVITASGTTYSNVSGPNAFPFNLGNSTNSFVTAPANSTYMNAFTNCLISPCNFTQPGTITVNVIINIPTINVTVTANTCLSSPSFTFQDLNNTPGLTYSWNFGDGSPAAVGNPITYNYAAAGIYTVTLTKSGGPSCVPAVQTLTVEVYPVPGSFLTVNSPVCYGGTASFTNTQTNGNTYSWSGPNNFVSAQQNPVISNVTASHGGVYTCTTTSPYGCTSVSSVSLTVYQETVSVTSNGSVCAGNPLQLTAGGSGTYFWSGPNSFTSSVQNPSFTPVSTAASGNYFVIATLTGNCSASAFVAVVVNTTAVTASNSSPVCFGNNLTLAAAGNGTFNWSGPNGFTSNQQSVTLTSPAVNASGVYAVTITSQEGCVATATTEVIIQAPKVLNPKATSSVCEGGTLYFEAMDGSGVVYSWKGPGNYSSVNANTAIQDAVPANSGQYTLTIKDVYGCTASAKVNVSVAPKPSVDIDMSKANAGCSPLCKVEYLAKSNMALAAFSWNLGNGEHSASSNPMNICYNQAGNYSVSLTGVDMNGCEAKVTKVLEVYPTPKAEFSYATGLTWVSSETKFRDESKGANIQDWYWSFGGTDASSIQQNPTYTFQDSGSYHVSLKVASDRGCESTIAKKVKISDEMGLYVPNAFTPNGDGSNDVFMAISNNVTKFDMQVFNRWGTMVFQSGDIRKGWDGTYKGAIAESAVYVYKISYTNKDAKVNTLSGNVTLIR